MAAAWNFQATRPANASDDKDDDGDKDGQETFWVNVPVDAEAVLLADNPDGCGELRRAELEGQPLDPLHGRQHRLLCRGAAWARPAVRA